MNDWFMSHHQRSPPSGAASIGKGIGGILFSRFSRSSGQVGSVEEEPSDSEGGVSEVENAGSGEEGASTTSVPESEEKEKQKEEERSEEEPAMSQSTSAIMDSTSRKKEMSFYFLLSSLHFAMPGFRSKSNCLETWLVGADFGRCYTVHNARTMTF